MSTLYTSLNEIKSFNPCISGWKAILRGQNKTVPDDVQFPLVDALESNSISDVLWLIGKRKKEIKIAAQFAKMCADSVAHLRTKKAASAAASAAAAAADYAADYAAYPASAAASAADYAAYAAYAAAADCAADYADYVDYADYAADYADSEQVQKNKQFLIQCINEYTE